METETLAKAAETITLFCRLKTSVKPDLPIRASEMGLLLLLEGSEAPITPAMAADFFRVKKPMITAMMNALRARGYAQSVPAPEDGRSFHLRLTPEGQSLVAATKGEYLESLNRLRAGMGDRDFQALTELLDKANRILLEDR